MSATTSLVIRPGDPDPVAVVHDYGEHRSPIGKVVLDGGTVSILAEDPTLLFRVADEFARAAHELRAALVQYAQQGAA